MMSGSWLRRPGVLSTLIVLCVGGVMLILTAIRYRQREQEQSTGHESPSHEIYEVKWDELPAIKPFQLTERSGETFDSQQMDGKVWVVSYFFSRCPSICKKQNEAIQRTRFQLRDRDVTFVSITCDPEYDRPEVLAEYATRYNADPDHWLFLTGAMNDIVRVGNESFKIAVGPETHSTSLMVIDRFGRYRDRIDWEQASELDRFVEVIDTCLAEQQAPAGSIVQTRVPFTQSTDAASPLSQTPERMVTSAAQVAELVGSDWDQPEWTERFTLVERNGGLVTSESMEGKVWIANFFFTRCPSICKRMTARVQELHGAMKDQGVTFVSITSDSAYDTPVQLATYALGLGLEMGDRSWLFLVGAPLQTRRVASEFFGAFADGEAHDERLFVIDKWGNVRGSFRYDDDGAIVELRTLVNSLLHEQEEPTPEQLQPKPVVPPDEELEWEDEGLEAPVSDGTESSSTESSSTESSQVVEPASASGLEGQTPEETPDRD